MDPTACRSLRRAHTVVALTALAFISYLTLYFRGEEYGGVAFHHRRSFEAFARQESSTRETTASPTSSTFITSSSASLSTSSTLTFSSFVSTRVPATIPSSSIPFSLSVSVPPISSIFSTSRSTQSAQTSASSSFNHAQPTNTRPKINVQPTPSTYIPPTTTFISTNNFVGPTVAQTSAQTPTVIPSSSPVSDAGASTGFWQRKGLVAATFVIVAVVLFATGTILIITFLKRTGARRQSQIHEELWDKFSETDHRSASPGASINAAPLDAFGSREVRCDGAPLTQHVLYPSSPVQHPDYYNQPLSPDSIASQTQAARRAAPPTAYQNTDLSGRNSYQPSIDSFYGATSQQYGYAA